MAKILFLKITTLLAEHLHEFRFPRSLTIRADTVVGLEPGTSKEQGELVTASIMWPGSSIGSIFFLPCVITSMYARFVINILMSIKVRD